MDEIRAADQRILRVVTVSQWVALTLGIIAGIVASEGATESYVAAAAGGLYVLTTTALPPTAFLRPLVLEAVSLVGSLLTMTAVALTGGTASPYILLSIIPPVAAAVLGGFRPGVATATLNGALLLAVAISSPRYSVVSAIGTAILYQILVLTVGQIRRILLDIENRAEALEATSAEASRRVAELESTYDLLTRLAEMASTNTGPIAVGQAALETVTSRIPGSAGSAVLSTPTGPVVIARIGTGDDHPHRRRVPLRVGTRTVGAVLLSSNEPLTDEDLESLDGVLSPVALSFANVLLLQEVASTAIKEERSRLARELHDEIGPTLATLGLALDTAVVQADDGDIARHLAELRGSVADLVDDVRSTVADLRSERHGSLVTRLAEASHAMSPPPTVELSLDERRPPRPSIVEDVSAIIIEAIRNAHQHSGGTSVKVRGWCDFDRGRLVVVDDGRGFDPHAEHSGHFGLVGIQERAIRAGAVLDVASDARGTRLTLEWGDR
jgi:signal transduction histidine kinase